jgi:hypothetical protein
MGRLSGTPRGRPGASAIDTKLLREVRSRGRTVGPIADTDRRAARVLTLPVRFRHGSSRRGGGRGAAGFSQEATSSGELVEEGLGFDQVEALGESVVDGRQELVGLMAPALDRPTSGRGSRPCSSQYLAPRLRTMSRGLHPRFFPRSASEQPARRSSSPRSRCNSRSQCPSPRAGERGRSFIQQPERSLHTVVIAARVREHHTKQRLKQVVRVCSYAASRCRICAATSAVQGWLGRANGGGRCERLLAETGPICDHQQLSSGCHRPDRAP